jgi:dienelactone hydrolase
MNRIVITDIFGKTPALDGFCNMYMDQLHIVDPYSGVFMDFKNESDAYEYFMSNVGLDDYCEILATKIRELSDPITLIGFSVGASAIWRISKDLEFDIVSNAFCFYGSQIRNNLEIEPRFHIDLILPKSEPHFSVADLSVSLSNQVNVTIHPTEYLHGFMNVYSENYNKDGYDHYTKCLDLKTN